MRQERKGGRVGSSYGRVGRGKRSLRISRDNKLYMLNRVFFYSMDTVLLTNSIYGIHFIT